MGFSSAAGEGAVPATFERGPASRTSGSTAKSNDLTEVTKNLQTSNYQKARSSEETSLPSFSSVRFIQPGEGILPNIVRWKDDVRMKVWAWAEKNLPPNHTRHSHSSGCDRIRHNRAARANAQGLLGCDPYFGRNAIYSGRNPNALARANRRYRGGRVSGNARGKFLWREPRCLRSRDCSHLIARDRVSFGEDGVSLRRHYPRYHRSDSAFASGVDNRAAPFSRSLSRNHCSSHGRRPVA